MLKNLRAISFQLAEPNDKGEVPEDIQIFKSGVFSYWEPGDMTMSREMFNSMIVNFQNKVRGTDIAVDYGHNAYAEAAGWIKQVYLKEEGDSCMLWAKVEWTKEAKEKLADKQYRYISGEFSMEYENEKGMKCGPTLWGAALTNRPFLKDMEPVIDMNEKLNKENLKMDELKKLTEENKNLAAQLSEKDKEIASLKEMIALAEKKRIEDEKTAKFNEMLKQEKVCEAQRESYMNGDVEKFSSLAKPFNTNGVGHSEDKKTEVVDFSTMTFEQAEEKVLELVNVKMGENKDLSNREALRVVLSENVELAKVYNK